MGSWRDRILREFTPMVARLTLAADPDGLLLEEGILAGIRERGFELIPFEDHIAFRYAYESKFRARWDRGEAMELVVVLHSGANDLGGLPYDLLQAGRKLAFSLGEVFPTLSYPVVVALDRGDLDALDTAQRKHAPGQLGDNATKEFVLRHVFGVAPELIKQPADLLRVLLRRHCRGQRIPAVLDARFIQILRQDDNFSNWPLETIVPDREALLAFLQERWPIFLDRVASEGEPSVREGGVGYNLAIAGPADLPFDHADVRAYTDSLFLEGSLHPVAHDCAEVLSTSWVGIGVRTDPAEDRRRRLAKLVEGLRQSLPAEDARHGDWLRFARGWAEAVVLSNEPGGTISNEVRQEVKDLQAGMDARFATWTSNRYAGLINLPPVPPVMVHHLPRFLARLMGNDRSIKIAMVVVDGLALDQWLVLRDALPSSQSGFRFREQAMFAWIPSITSVSRQAAFAGKPPIFFPDSVETTAKESALWTQFWADQGLASNEVVYEKGLGDGSLEGLSELLSHPKVRVIGLVVDKVDKIMHGMQLGTAGMHNQIRQWAQGPYMVGLLDLLLDHGFRVYLTSDHGNIEAEGCGRPMEGVIADLRGERARVYPAAALRSRVKGRFPAALEWPSLGLPNDYLPLLAPGRRAFVAEKERIVGHGGISVEELIVPLVDVERGRA